MCLNTNLRLENMSERNSYKIIIAIFFSQFHLVQNYIGVNDKTYRNKLVFASCYFSDDSLHFCFLSNQQDCLVEKVTISRVKIRENVLTRHKFTNLLKSVSL